jgi:4-amino-4-deoxy-L-arabinose transferase-like glycosyltransferase
MRDIERDTGPSLTVGLAEPALVAGAGEYAARRLLELSAAVFTWLADRQLYAATMLGILAASCALRAHGLFLSNADWDEGVYIIMGQRWNLGGLPYVAVWDQHPPGMAALFALVQRLVSDPVLGARLAALFAVTVTALLIHRFCVRYLSQAGAGLIGALLYIVCMSRWLGLAANTEVFNNACVTLASYLLYGASQRSPASLARAVAAAVVLGVGLQIKYVVLPEAAILCLAYLAASYRANRDLRATVMAAGALVLAGLLPTGMVVLYFWQNAALQPFLDANVGSNISYLDVRPALSVIARRTATGIAPLVGAILITGLAIWHAAKRRRIRLGALTPQLWILVWVVAAMLDVSLPLKFFSHYDFALYPPLCLAGALALTALTQDRRRALAVGLVVLFATAAPYWASGFARAVRVAQADAPRAVADVLRAAGGSALNVFVYEYQPVIYALALVRPPTPYVLSSELSTFTYSSHVDGADEVRRTMDSAPDFVVLRVRPPDEPEPVALDDVVRQRLGAYHLVGEVTDGVDKALVRIYRR